MKTHGRVVLSVEEVSLMVLKALVDQRRIAGGIDCIVTFRTTIPAATKDVVVDVGARPPDGELPPNVIPIERARRT